MCMSGLTLNAIHKQKGRPIAFKKTVQGNQTSLLVMEWSAETLEPSNRIYRIRRLITKSVAT